MAAEKKKIIKSLENLEPELLALIDRQYPQGYQSSLKRITTPKKETIFVFPLETEEATFLVKVPAIKNSEGDYDVQSRKDGDEFALPRDRDGLNEDQDDLEQDQDDQDDYDDDGGGGRGRKEQSYDPDFDN